VSLNICLLTLTQQMLSDTGAKQSETEGLVDYTLFSQGVKTGALLREIDSSHTKVSLRSKGALNVAAIASRFGGGGHVNAAGCMLSLSLPQARAEILRILTVALDD
ncbi:MAG: DHHA1 domain-containing protein, partial [candidate division Zixibacteria bacterium]|nr:DHHA1 domain-containing protein [candidate division Zixibacteria bacterium]